MTSGACEYKKRQRSKYVLQRNALTVFLFIGFTIELSKRSFQLSIQTKVDGKCCYIVAILDCWISNRPEVKSESSCYYSPNWEIITWKFAVHLTAVLHLRAVLRAKRGQTWSHPISLFVACSTKRGCREIKSAGEFHPAEIKHSHYKANIWAISPVPIQPH